MEFTEEKKKELEQAIVDACIGALEKNLIKEEDMGDISFFVLERIDLIKNQNDLIEFLGKLSDKWKIFESLRKIAEGQAEVIQDQQVANNVQELIKQGNIDQALEVTRSANGGSE